MKRLTDRKTAANLKANADGLRAVGLEPTISDRRYVKLAEYENRDEVFENIRKERLQEKGYCKDCAYHTFHGTILFCNKHYVPMLYESGCDDFFPREIYITQKEGE